jgi:uncharacterized repeat protein (TIGR01451 family)
MRRSLGYLAMGLVLIGGGLVAISEEGFQSYDSFEPLLSLLGPSRALAAPTVAVQSADDESAAYFRAQPSVDSEIKPTGNAAPATNTSSRRTQLDSRFEDTSLSLSEDEPEEFRQEMGPSPTAAEKLPSAHTPVATTPGLTRPNVASALSSVPSSFAPTPEEPEHAAMVTDEPLSVAPSDDATPEATKPVEVRPAPFVEPRRLSSEGLTNTAPSEHGTQPSAQRFATEPSKADATDEIPAWNGDTNKPIQQEMIAAAATASDKPSAGAVSVHWLTPSEVDRGDEIPCRLQVTNEGETPAVAVAVHVELPEHAELASATATASTEGRMLSWKLDRLEPRESKTFELRLLPKGEGDFAPTASVTYTRAATASIHVLDPQLAVSIEGPEQALVSQPAMYQLRVSNPGTGKARNVVVQARLDARLSHPSGTELEYSIGTLGPGETRLLEVPVTGTTLGEGNIVAEATSANRLSAQGGCMVEIVRPALALALEGPKLRFVDRKAVFTLTVHNPGVVAATNVQIFGSVPAGYKYQSATAGGGFDETMSAVAWFVGRLEPQATVKVEYELVARELGAHRVLAMVRADLGVDERTELDTTVDGVPSVALDMTGPDAPIEVGGQASYRLEVTNRGTKAANNVQVACRVPAEMEAANAQGATSGLLSGDRIVFEPLPTLAPRESKVYEVLVTCRRPGDVRFRSFFRSDECREVVQQETLTRIYQD